MTDQSQERRGALRVDARLSLRIDTPGDDSTPQSTILETINISTSGAYFQSASFLPPMTKLALQLELPVISELGGTAEDVELVACEGLVVRTTPEEELAHQESYEIAVFFTHLEAGAAEVLERHIATFLQPGD